jgi:hypothetical protein
MVTFRFGTIAGPSRSLMNLRKIDTPSTDLSHSRNVLTGYIVGEHMEV